MYFIMQVAHLAGIWAALQFPDADVRCITFGSPRVGNAAYKVWKQRKSKIMEIGDRHKCSCA